MTMAAAATNAMPAPTADAPPGPLYIDTQHDDMVHDAQLDYYGCKLATSSSGKWNALNPSVAVPFQVTYSPSRPYHQDLQCYWFDIRAHSYITGTRGSCLASIVGTPEIWSLARELLV